MGDFASQAVYGSGAAEFVVDELVDARFCEKRGAKREVRFDSAKITAVNEDGSYDVEWDDLDAGGLVGTEKRVPSKFIRKREAADLSSSAPPAASGPVPSDVAERLEAAKKHLLAVTTALERTTLSGLPIPDDLIDKRVLEIGVDLPPRERILLMLKVAEAEAANLAHTIGGEAATGTAMGTTLRPVSRVGVARRARAPALHAAAARPDARSHLLPRTSQDVAALVGVLLFYQSVGQPGLATSSAAVLQARLESERLPERGPRKRPTDFPVDVAAGMGFGLAHAATWTLLVPPLAGALDRGTSPDAALGRLLNLYEVLAGSEV